MRRVRPPRFHGASRSLGARRPARAATTCRPAAEMSPWHSLSGGRRGGVSERPLQATGCCDCPTKVGRRVARVGGFVRANRPATIEVDFGNGATSLVSMAMTGTTSVCRRRPASIVTCQTLLYWLLRRISGGDPEKSDKFQLLVTAAGP